MEELVTKIRVRKGLKVCDFLLYAGMETNLNSFSLKSLPLTHITTSCSLVIL